MYTISSVSGLGTIAAIAAGGQTSYALRTDCTVMAWGNNFADSSALRLTALSTRPRDRSAA